MSLRAFMSRDAERGNPSYRRSRKQEKEIAGKLGAKRTIASGSKDEKGDVRLRGVMRIEAKTTKNKSFSVTLEMVRQIEDAALGADELPIIAIEFNDGRGNKIKEVAVVPMYVLDLIRSSK